MVTQVTMILKFRLTKISAENKIHISMILNEVLKLYNVTIVVRSVFQ